MRTPQPFAQRDYSTPRRRAKTAAVRALSRALDPLGLNIELQHFYSPIPQRGSLSHAFWATASEMAGVSWDLEGQLQYVSKLGPMLEEFRPPIASGGHSHEYFLRNGLFQGVDADLLYAMIRQHRPSLIIELGAGFSTLVAAQACAANAAAGVATCLESFDPFAVPPPTGEVPGLSRLRPVAAEEVPFEEFARLRNGDILFVDTSHTVRIGGDTTHIVLEILPRLQPGVIVHFHDIFLPWHYPQDWIEHNRWYWAEQYLLQAFLAHNRDWEVLIGAHALSRQFPNELRQLIVNFDPARRPLSLWLRRSEHAVSI